MVRVSPLPSVRGNSSDSPLRDDYLLSGLLSCDSISLIVSRCSVTDPLPERAPVPGTVFPTPTEVPEPFDVPAPSPVDVPVQMPQDIPAPPSEWPDDPALTLRASGSLPGVFTPSLLS